jgi:DNA replication protein DnaC
MNRKFEQIVASMEEEIKSAPVMPPEPKQEQKAPCLEFPARNGVPKRYREPEWSPDDPGGWREPYTKARAVLKDGGILSLVGGRGSGKTRLAIEVARRMDSTGTRYMAAMDVFLRLQACYRPAATETEVAVLQELSRCRVLILDEIQERGNSEWEDRILTHLIDKRYGSMLPTVLIANLKPDELKKRLGPSIMDRMAEGGGLLEITGTSHRRRSR